MGTRPVAGVAENAWANWAELLVNGFSSTGFTRLASCTADLSFFEEEDDEDEDEGFCDE